MYPSPNLSQNSRYELEYLFATQQVRQNEKKLMPYCIIRENLSVQSIMYQVICVLTLKRWSATVHTRLAWSLQEASIIVPVESNSTELMPALLPTKTPRDSHVPDRKLYK